MIWWKKTYNLATRDSSASVKREYHCLVYSKMQLYFIVIRLQ